MAAPDPVTGQMRSEVPDGFRSGFACFVGRPNAGKSTLTNALVGSKIAIASSKPQTTRHAIRGIVHRADAQLVLIDLDHVSESNVNRQIQATSQTLDMSKAEALARRIADIHPGCVVHCVEEFADATLSGDQFALF